MRLCLESCWSCTLFALLLKQKEVMIPCCKSVLLEVLVNAVRRGSLLSFPAVLSLFGWTIKQAVNVIQHRSTLTSRQSLLPMAFPLSQSKLSSSSKVPSQSLNINSSSITSKILKDGKIADGLPWAFVTLLAGTGDDIMGVVCLAKGLRKVGSAYPLVAVVLPGVPEEHLQILKSQGCVLREAQPVYQTQFGMDCNVINFSKLKLWDLNEYKKMVYLDPKVQVYSNIDKLFEYPKVENVDCGMLYAVQDCRCKKMLANNPQYNINLCQEEPYFSDGVFVFQPSKKTFNFLAEKLQLISPTPTSFSVQDYLNMFFKDVYKPISLIYNLNLPMLWNHSELMDVVDLNKIKVVHYCAKGSQPWSYTGDDENMQREDVKLLVKKWWDVYNDSSLDYKPPAQEDSVEPVSL